MNEFYQLPKPHSHPIWRLTLKIFFKIFYFLKIEGRGNLPKNGPFLLASNHPSYFDPPLVAIGCREPVFFMAWAALFRGPRWFANLIGRFGAFPVDLERADAMSFRLSLEVLRRGHRLAIFPEGGRQVEGKLMDLRAGVARLAMHAGAPIVPVRIEGSWAAWPKPRKWPYLFKPIKITFGPPIPPPPRRLPPPERDAAAREIMDKLRAFMESGKGITN